MAVDYVSLAIPFGCCDLTNTVSDGSCLYDSFIKTRQAANILNMLSTRNKLPCLLGQ